MNPFADFAGIIGIDWADRKHDLCLKTFGFDALEYSILEHKPEAIEDWANDLRVRFNGMPVAVCIESRKVPPHSCSAQVRFPGALYRSTRSPCVLTAGP